MEKIRIVNLPPGQAPKWVRKEWLGLELPVDENIPSPENLIQSGTKFLKPETVIKTAKKMTGDIEKDWATIQRMANLKKYKGANEGGYPVKTLVAIEILKEKSPKAAKWWEENLCFDEMSRLVFKKEVCELI